MKRILFALTTLAALLLPLASRAEAATDVSLNFFYDNLSTQGSWIEVADYGYCFQPNVAVSNANWRPYADGYWAYTDAGWTWVSYEDFGWATYHYGRWSRLSDYGWVWVPGYEWAPAWVSWRTGGDYVGWAPLPPSADRVYEGRAITGQVDVEFDIGPQYYNFVDVRYIGEPVLRDRIFEPARNVTIINRTVNVTNITYNNSIVYNYGPNYNRLNQYSTRPIQRLTLQRETTVGANFGAQGGGRGANFNHVNGNQLMVVAPAIQKSQQPIAPKQVKAKVEQPKIEHGWQGIENRQQIVADMKKENAQNVAPPSFQPQKGRKNEAVGPAGEAGNDQPAGAAQAAPANQEGAGRPMPRRGRIAPQNVNADRTQEGGNRANKREANTGDQSAATQPNEAARAAQPAPESGDNQQAESAAKLDKRAASQAQRRGRRQNAAPPEQANANGSGEQNAERPAAKRAEPAQEAEPQPPDHAGQTADQTREPKHAKRVAPAAQAQESQRPDRADGEAPPKRAEPAGRAQQPPESERPPDSRPPAQASPQQHRGDQNPDAPRKGKKKKPEDEKPPEP